MVLQHDVGSPFPVHEPRHAPGGAPRPDPVRITGLTGALLFNAAALMLMLAPLGQQSADHPAPRGLQADWFEPRPVPPPPPPEIVPVVQPATPRVSAAPVPRAMAPDPAPVAPPVVEGGRMAADPVPVAARDAGGDLGPPASGPLAGVQLAYAEASAPPYPREALRAGHQGTVLLQVLVDVDGRPLEVRVEHGSGYRQLDEAARRHVLRHWRFQPAMRDGRAVQAIGLVPIDFRLDRG